MTAMPLLSGGKLRRQAGDSRGRSFERVRRKAVASTCSLRMQTSFLPFSRSEILIGTVSSDVSRFFVDAELAQDQADQHLARKEWKALEPRCRKRPKCLQH